MNCRGENYGINLQMVSHLEIKVFHFATTICIVFFRCHLCTSSNRLKRQAISQDHAERPEMHKIRSLNSQFRKEAHKPPTHSVRLHEGGRMSMHHLTHPPTSLVRHPRHESVRLVIERDRGSAVQRGRPWSLHFATSARTSPRASLLPTTPPCPAFSSPPPSPWPWSPLLSVRTIQPSLHALRST